MTIVDSAELEQRRQTGQLKNSLYDIKIVNEPEQTIRPLIEWLDLEWTINYLHPERSERSINTASVIEARQPISNKSVGGWKNYRELLKPAEDILNGNSFFNI